MKLSQQSTRSAAAGGGGGGGSTNLVALSLQEDATSNTFSTLDTNEAALYRLRYLTNWSMPRLLAYLYSEKGQSEIQEAFQLNEKSDLTRQCIAVVGFGQLLLAGWHTATAVDCGEGGIHDYVHDNNPSAADTGNGMDHHHPSSSSLAESRKPKEDFIEFCCNQMRVLGSLALSCACETDTTGVNRLPLLEACSEVLSELLMAYSRPAEVQLVVEAVYHFLIDFSILSISITICIYLPLICG